MADKPKTLNDIAWELLFEKYDILNQIDISGDFKISAGQIKEFREPRLMAKVDTTLNLPDIFEKNKLSILPITRGDYIISHYEIFHKFETRSKNIEFFSLPSHIQSIDINNISSEAVALNCAVATGIISDFLNDEVLVATVSGRMGSDTFDFNINNVKSGRQSNVQIINSQIEIDAAYEGLNGLAIFEAKRELSADFIIRQIYYPFRLWNKRITKPIRPIFLVYSNGIYNLYEYLFEDVNNYNSLLLIKHKTYSIEDTTIDITDIESILYNTKIVPEPHVPFPQANSFNRVINLCELLSGQELTRNDVTDNYSFDARQTNYYTDAAIYLGLVEKQRDAGTPVYKLNDDGKRINKLNFKQRQLEYCKRILSHKVFNDILRKYFETGEMPPKKEIIQIMQSSNLYNINEYSTFERRSSTVRGWINWIVSLIND